VDPDVAHGLVRADSAVEDAVRRYILREIRQRVHQPVFRATIMRAYGTRCAVCALAHTELLDAAHIIPDSHEYGLKERHDQRLMVLPRVRGERPGEEFLEWRYDVFQGA
jgi:putative restriction endonuclease